MRGNSGISRILAEPTQGRQIRGSCSVGRDLMICLRGSLARLLFGRILTEGTSEEMLMPWIGSNNIKICYEGLMSFTASLLALLYFQHAL
ncbi:hypothetical protein M5K25_010875 [Dendrobium thyrsiflorum]|uniref:Uncharacterized protein n=1 Tax=Dendrobium thyrsiflorum TaxID=117978 RepID=A0ABD0V1Q2_DENTH